MSADGSALHRACAVDAWNVLDKTRDGVAASSDDDLPAVSTLRNARMPTAPARCDRVLAKRAVARFR